MNLTALRGAWISIRPNPASGPGPYHIDASTMGPWEVVVVLDQNGGIQIRNGQVTVLVNVAAIHSVRMS